MDSKYEIIEFPNIKDINNLEYKKVCFELKTINISKRVVDKLKRIYKSKLGK